MLVDVGQCGSSRLSGAYMIASGLRGSLERWLSLRVLRQSNFVSLVATLLMLVIDDVCGDSI